MEGGGAGVIGGATNFDDSSLNVPGGQQPEMPSFTAVSGTEVIMTGEKPTDFFHLYMTDDVLDHIMLETKEYANQTNYFYQSTCVKICALF